MRILNEDKDETIKNILLCLTLDEARELRDSLTSLIRNKNKPNHAHVNDAEYWHEITITVYDENNLQGFNSRVLNIIKEDK